MNTLCTELTDAIINHDLAQQWALARLLSGKRRGPKNRKLAVPQMEAPTSEEWKTYLSQAGPEGGCEATIIQSGEEYTTGAMQVGIEHQNNWRDPGLVGEKYNTNNTHWNYLSMRLTEKQSQKDHLQKKHG